MMELINKENENPLHLACENSQIHLIKSLLVSNTNINSMNTQGLSPLHVAVIKGNVEVTELLINEGADIELKDSQYGSSPLLHACQNGRVNIVKLLIEKGANVKSESTSGTNALHFATQSGNIKVVELVIDGIGDVNSKDINGMTALHLAAETGNLKLLDVLIGKGADINLSQTLLCENNALHFSAKKGFVKTVIYLIKKGCNIYCRNSHNHTFLQHIFRNPEIDEASKIDIIEAMLDIGADVNSFDIILSPFEKIPLLFSSLLNCMDKLFKVLVNNGAKLTNDVPILQSTSVFDLAIKYRRFSAAKAILAVGPYHKDKQNLNVAEQSLKRKENDFFKIVLYHHLHHNKIH